MYCLFILRMTILFRVPTIRRYDARLFWALQELAEKNPECWEDSGLYLKNVLLFIPFGYLLSIVTNLKYKTIALIGLGLSLGIELLQYFFAIGLAELDDLIANTIGTAIGYWARKKQIIFKVKKELKDV